MKEYEVIWEIFNKCPGNQMRDVFVEEMELSDPEAYVKAHGLEQVSDTGLVESVVEQVFADNPKSIADYQAGKQKAFGFLVGQTMRQLKGKADPKVVNQVIRAKLEQL